MTPTAKLRFVQRGTEVPLPDDPRFFRQAKIRVLQQWWIDENHLTPAEWRDVPLEME